MNKLKLIIIREFLSKIRNRTFIIMTFISPLIMVGMIAILVLVTKSSMDKKREVSYIDESGLFDNQSLNAGESVVFHNLTGTDLTTAKEAVRKTGQYGLLYIPSGETPDEIARGILFFSEKPPGLTFTERIENLLSKKLTEVKMKNMQLDIQKFKSAKVDAVLGMQSFEGKESSKLETGLKFGIGSMAGYFLFLFIVVYGSLVMRSVIEEKTTRIVEVIISSVKPFQLMMGKVLGTGAAGLLQFLIWGVLLMLLYMLALPLLGIDASAVSTSQISASQEALKNTVTPDKITQVLEIINNLPVGLLIISFLLYFFGGFLLYSSLYAAVGAAVDNETDSQQFMMPIMIPLMLAIYIGFAVAADDPHGTIATVFSFIPFTSPIVMMMRIPLGAPLWQVALSLLILYITFVGVIWIAGKIYRVGILSYGKKPTYKDLYKWLKYS